MPDNSVFYSNRIFAWLGKRDFEKATTDFDHFIRLRPESAPAHRWIAWLLATYPEEQLRDGRRAMQLATRACALSGWKSAFELDTLAAAYAEAGRFDDAVRIQLKALDARVCRVPDRNDLLRRLELYKQKKPFRQSR